ncbi:antibiotic biosynthesis monooxygenase [Pseudomonas sp. B11D7D]|nr:antibiotic biosynthesis monooxygenase [Pseudomonas sp. B11D7D]QNH04173.1 antibiotic biosynthesis monooxygenase [Pseudomonas sp. B11D7D]
MIHEIAVLPAHRAQIEQFKQAFAEVVHLLERAKGYHGHLFTQGIESPETFNLIVRWASLEDHTPGFEASDDHQTFMAGLEQYFSQEPTVYHIQEVVFINGNQQGQASAFNIAEPKA